MALTTPAGAHHADDPLVQAESAGAQAGWASQRVALGPQDAILEMESTVAGGASFERIDVYDSAGTLLVSFEALFAEMDVSARATTAAGSVEHVLRNPIFSGQAATVWPHGRDCVSAWGSGMGWSFDGTQNRSIRIYVEGGCLPSEVRVLGFAAGENVLSRSLRLLAGAPVSVVSTSGAEGAFFALLDDFESSARVELAAAKAWAAVSAGAPAMTGVEVDRSWVGTFATDGWLVPSQGLRLEHEGRAQDCPCRTAWSADGSGAWEFTVEHPATLGRVFVAGVDADLA